MWLTSAVASLLLVSACADLILMEGDGTGGNPGIDDTRTAADLPRDTVLHGVRIEADVAEVQIEGADHLRSTVTVTNESEGHRRVALMEYCPVMIRLYAAPDSTRIVFDEPRLYPCPDVAEEAFLAPGDRIRRSHTRPVTRFTDHGVEPGDYAAGAFISVRVVTTAANVELAMDPITIR